MKKPAIIFLSITVLLTFIPDAHAALDNSGVLDSVLMKYKAAASSWAAVIQERATWLFLALMTISIVWTFIPLMFHRSSFPEIFGEMVRFCAFCGFFLWLLTNGPAMANAIISSLHQIGAEASGKEIFYPSGIVDIGFQIFSKTLSNLSLWEIGESIATFLISAVILVILALVGINMLLQLCAAWVLAYAGIFFLGFGGSKWTSDMAINYFKTVLGIGASLMTMTLLVGVGTDIINDAHARMDTAVKLEELGILLVFSLTLLLLVDKLPAMVAGIITGAGVGSMGVGAFGAGAAVGAAMTTSAAVTGAAAASVAGALGGAGAVSSIRAAMQAASGTAQGGSSEGNGRSLSDAMGVKTPFAAAAQTLGKSAARMAGEGLKGAMNNTAGGRLAQKIRESSGQN